MANTGAALIDDLVGQMVLIEMNGQRRNRLFLFHEYLNQFREQP